MSPFTKLIPIRRALLVLTGLSLISPIVFPYGAYAQNLNGDNGANVNPDFQVSGVDTWESLGRGNEQFNHPSSLSVESNGQRAYVADSDNNRIVVLHDSGHYLTSWGTLGKGAGQFHGPGSVALDEAKKAYFCSRYWKQ